MEHSSGLNFSSAARPATTPDPSHPSRKPPFSPGEQVRATVASTAGATRVDSEDLRRPHDPEGRRLRLGLEFAFPEIVGESSPMHDLLRFLDRLRRESGIVLLTGPSGAGKTLVARTLHVHGPFEDIPLTGLAASIVESELFGHETGSFTGAARRHRGAFERAAGGTCFLDEIGDAPLSLQAKLLGVLDGREYVRVGGEERLPVRCRFVFATHRLLNLAVEARTFREDLYWRIQPTCVAVPSLRERSSDIPALVRHLLSSRGLDPNCMGEEALRALASLPWAGEMRHLAAVVAALASSERPDSASTVFAIHASIPVPAATGLAEASLQTGRTRVPREALDEAAYRRKWAKGDTKKQILQELVARHGPDIRIIAASLHQTPHSVRRQLNRLLGRQGTPTPPEGNTSAGAVPPARQ
ncbi:MAG: sigma-54-dependent Fis family transcriptional regulator [Candidatus Brocadiae bacterium]|nr:sigma-54-dependent Fis family transcriptional regulator [Candidatus Brocadiia bacterium]